MSAPSLPRLFVWSLDPIQFAIDSGLTFALDETQRRLLLETGNVVATTARQWGKSTVISRIALREAVLHADSLTLAGAATMDQAMEFVRKCRDGLAALARHGTVPAIKRESMTEIELQNGARVKSVCGAERAWRGPSQPSLVVIDESAIVPDECFFAAVPLIGEDTGQRIVLLSSAGRELGFHFRIATDSAMYPGWARYVVAASDCPHRWSAEWLAAKKLELGARDFAREYETCWLDQLDALFSNAEIEGATDPGVRPWFPGRHLVEVAA